MDAPASGWEPSVQPSPSRTQWLYRGIAVLAAVACASLPAAILFQQASTPRALGWTVVGMSFALAAALLVAARRYGAGAGEALASLALYLSTERLWPALSAGLALRLAVDVFVPAVPSSDGAVYLGLAQAMAAGEAYFTAGTKAYWPPGLSLALVPLLKVIGSAQVAISVLGLGCFALACSGTWRLGHALGMGRATGVAVWLLAFWPGHVLATGLPEKELLVVALLPWVLVAAWRAWTGAWSASIAAGALLGLVCLVQPSFQLLPLTVLLATCIWSRRRLRLAGQVLLSIAAMLVVLSPWTYRNWQVLSAPVLVSTNGGSNLYRANNELATGAFVARGTVNVEALPELEADRVGKRLAVQWISENPVRFLQLSAGKILLFLGDDSYGAYAAFGRGGFDIGRAPYLAAKLVCMLAWWCGWALILVAMSRHAPAKDAGGAAPWVLLAMPVLYLLCIHSVFESGGKYHVPLLAPYLLLVASAVSHLWRQQQRVGAKAQPC